MPTLRTLVRRLALAAATTAALLLAAPSAALALTPGANGPIVINTTTFPPPRHNRVEFYDPDTGALARETYELPGDGATGVSDMVFNTDGRHIATVQTNTQTTGNVHWFGSQLGSLDDLFQAFGASGSVWSPVVLDDARLCNSSNRVVAALPNGNYLWLRSDWAYHDPSPIDPAHPCNTPSSDSMMAMYENTPSNAQVRTFPRKPLNAVSTIEYTGRYFSSTSPDLVYQYQTSDSVAEPSGLYRFDLATNTRTLLSHTIHEVSDLTADGATGVYADGNLYRIDVATETPTTVLTAAQIAALEPAAPGVGAAGTGGNAPKLSPDGTKILFQRGYAFGVVGIDGSNPHIVHMYTGNDVPVSWGWMPSPGLDLDVEASPLDGDVLELDLKLHNGISSRIDNLAYSSFAPFSGIEYSTGAYAAADKLGVTVLGGPTPGLGSSIEAGGTRTHQYLVGVDKPGFAYVRAKVTGTPVGLAPVTATSEILGIQASTRDQSKGEKMATMTAGYAYMAYFMQRYAEAKYNQTWAQINRTLVRTLPRPMRVRATNMTPAERATARALGLPDKALSWLPTNKRRAGLAVAAFLQAEKAAQQRVLKRHLGRFANKTFVVPYEFWSEQLTGDPTTTIPVGEALYREGAYWTNRGKTAANGYATAAYQAVSDPDLAFKLLAAQQQAVQTVRKKVARIKAAAPGQAVRFARAVQEDPVKAARIAGNMYGTVKTETNIAVATTVFSPTPAGVAHGVRNTGNSLRKFLNIAGTTIEDERTLATMTTATRMAGVAAADTLPTAAKLGMPKADQTAWRNVIATIEDSVQSKFGVKLNMQLSFRPRNVYSGSVKGGVGKNMFIKKAKAGTDLDVTLGMDRIGLGKAAIYNPRRPFWYRFASAEKRMKMDDRIKEMRAAVAEWTDASSAVGKARRSKGFTGVATVGENNAVVKIKMRLSGKTTRGTTVMQYDELVVDGRTIVKRGTKPHPVVSDYDGNAILQANGKELPPQVRGFVELETMRLQRELGTKGVAVSFHGFTKNGFDLPAKAYRGLFKFLLEGLSPKQKKQALSIYLAKYHQPGDSFDELLKSYATNDFVIKVTRTGATGGHGY